MRKSSDLSAVQNGLVQAKGLDVPPVERRPKRRKRVLLGAVVSYAEGKFGIDCTIRDLSETGARIAIPKNAQLPSKCFLINVRDRLAYDAEAMWQNGSEVGLRFTRVLKLTDISDPALGFLKRQWLERAVR